MENNIFSLSVIIPVFNEERLILNTLEDIEVLGRGSSNSFIFYINECIEVPRKLIKIIVNHKLKLCQV